MESNYAPLTFARIVMEGIKDMVFIVKVDENCSFSYEFVNQAVMEKTVLTSAATGKPFHEVHAQPVAAFLTTRYKKIIEKNHVLNYEDTCYVDNNQVMYTKSVFTPLHNTEGICTHIVNQTIDITAEKIAAQHSKENMEKIKRQNDRLHSLFVHHTDSVVTIDLHGLITNGNSLSSERSGYSLDELKGQSWFDFVAAEHQQLAKNHFYASHAGEKKEQRLHLLNKLGESVPCLVNYVPIIEATELSGYYVIAKDMTELDKIAKFYEVTEANYRIIAENIHDVIMLVTPQKEFVYVSPSAEAIYGFSVDHRFQQTFFERIHPDDLPIVSAKLDQALEKLAAFQLQFQFHHQEKGWIWIELSGTPILANNQSLEHVVMVARDISIQKEYENQLKHFAYFDSLTELPNRRYFQQYANERLDKFKSNTAVLMLDIDDFKEINDQWGHEVGDAVIQEIGSRLTTCMEGNNIAARLGGDEFIILLTEIETREQVTGVANEIYRVMKEPILVSPLSFHISVSMGIALAPEEQTTISAMMKRADLAMYNAKQQEKNSFSVSLL